MRKKVVKLIRILFASPGDTAEERAVAHKVVEELNRVWGERTGIWLKSLMWEVDKYVASGEDGQAVIHEQFGDHYEAFVGIMRERFGSPTVSHESGTQEEYLRAYARGQINPDSVDIAFYFSSSPVSREHLNPQRLHQLQKLLAFRKEVRWRGTLEQDYSSLDEFEVRIRLHLNRLLQQWEGRPASGEQMSFAEADDDVLTTGSITGGLLLSEETLARDLSTANRYLERANEVRIQIPQAIERSAEAHELGEVGDMIGPLVVAFGQCYRGALLSASRAAALTAATRTNVDGARRLADALEILRAEFDSLGNALAGWKSALVATKATTLEVLRNRRHCLYAVDALLAESKSISSLMADVASALRDASE